MIYDVNKTISLKRFGSHPLAFINKKRNSRVDTYAAQQFS